MGTDVHAIFQARKDGRWQEIESKWDQRRHYLLFSWLANVRNGFGFAGVPTYDPIKPIAMPRGVPADFAEQLDGDMGDHTFSWLTADEILAAERPKVHRTGVVPIAWFRKWDGKTQPDGWSGSISGPGIVVASMPSNITPDTTHVQIEWDGPAELDYFVDEVKRLKAEHGDVRMVFGFDS